MIRWVILALVLALPPVVARAAPAVRANDFMQSVGVNIHSGWPGNDLPALLTELRYLQIHFVRDTINGAMAGGSAVKFAAFGRAGLRWDIIVGTSPQDYRDWLVQHRAAIDALEGPNEPDLEKLRYAGLIGAPAGAVVQTELYKMARGDAGLRAIPILSDALAYLETAPPPGVYDVLNVHAYAPAGRPPAATLARRIIDAGPPKALPVIVSETGYPTLTGDTGHNGVTEKTQANYLLDALADDFAAGVRRTYLYDLKDDGADLGGIDKEMHFGLFHNDGSPKPAALALHNLLTLLTDSGPNAAGFTPTSLTFRVSPPVATVLLQKQDGDYEMVLWSEPKLWTAAGYTISLTPAQKTVTVALPDGHYDVAVYDPLAGTIPRATSHSTNQLKVTVGSGPLVLQIAPSR